MDNKPLEGKTYYSIGGEVGDNFIETHYRSTDGEHSYIKTEENPYKDISSEDMIKMYYQRGKK